MRVSDHYGWDQEPLDQKEDEGEQHRCLVAVIIVPRIIVGPAGVRGEHHHGALQVGNYLKSWQQHSHQYPNNNDDFTNDNCRARHAKDPENPPFTQADLAILKMTDILPKCSSSYRP